MRYFVTFLPYALITLLSSLCHPASFLRFRHTNARKYPQISKVMYFMCYSEVRFMVAAPKYI